VTLEQLEKFCAPKNFRIDLLKKPFFVDHWRVASDGYVLVADSGPSAIKLPHMEECADKENIRRMLAFPIGELRYSTEHLLGFLGDDKPHSPDASNALREEAAIINGYRVNMVILRKVFALAGMDYQLAFRKTESGHCFHFKLGKVLALVMGLKSSCVTDLTYKPKEIALARC